MNERFFVNFSIHGVDYGWEFPSNNSKYGCMHFGQECGYHPSQESICGVETKC